jgi:signal transduction histidine kinase
MNQWREGPQNYRMPVPEPHSEALELTTSRALPPRWFLRSAPSSSMSDFPANAMTTKLTSSKWRRQLKRRDSKRSRPQRNSKFEIGRETMTICQSRRNALVGLHSQEEVRSLQVLDFLVPEDKPRARDEAWPIARRSGRWVGELPFRHFTTGAGIPFLIDWFRIDDSRTGGSLNIAAVARDLRAQKKSEAELLHLNETLENRVVQCTAELADAHKKLLTEMSEHERIESRLREAHLELGHAARLSSAGQIAAALAHELNQPLTAIANSLGAAKRLLARGSFIGIEPATEAMDEAVQQSLRAAHVVSRLRNFLIRGETETRCENIAAMVDEARALALIGPTASGVEIRVLLDPEAPHIVADRIEIQQVLINLMRNALEAMAGMDRRKLRVTTTLRRPDLVEFAVADSGPGIGAEMAERIFEPFVTTKRDGMGLGLWICRSIIETHGSHLQFEPNPEGGTIFHFTLPAAVLPDRELDAG